MILGAEVAMLVLGVYYLFKGKTPHNPKAKYVNPGWSIRVIGLICILPIPLSILAGIALGIWGVAMGKDVGGQSYFWVRTGMEGATVGICLLAVAIVSHLTRVPVEVAQTESVQPQVPPGDF